jgi:hypothetical protein
MNARLEELKTALARRLGPILPDVPADLFEEVINLVASLQWERESKRLAHERDREHHGDSVRQL